MKGYLPARFTRTQRRKVGVDRGKDELPIFRDEAFSAMEKRLRHIRDTGPRKFALFPR